MDTVQSPKFRELWTRGFSCFCYAFVRLFINALWSPAGKRQTSWLSSVMSIVKLSLSHWYPGSGAVFDCIDS